MHGKRLTRAAQLLLIAAVALGSTRAGAEQGYGGVLAEGWRVGLGAGTVELPDGTEAGRAVTASLGLGARIVTDQGARWDFEVGLAHTESTSQPRDADGGRVPLRQTDLHYTARRLVGGSPWFAGWRAALSRLSLRPERSASTRDLTYALGLVGGWLADGGYGVQLEAQLTEPTPDGLGLEAEVHQYRLQLLLAF